jgi:hypothetical protein
MPAKDDKAEPQAEAPKKLDECVPGGSYLVGDVLVDADGKPVKDKKEPAKAEPSK